MNVEENIYLRSYTTLGVGGPARYFIEAYTPDELQEAVTFAATKNIPIFVLGDGSNILIADDGFDGLVIRNRISGVSFNELDEGRVEMVAGAGENWDRVVEYAVNQRLWGIENLSGIPGTVGAAPVQNIGAYGAELKDVFQWVEVVDRRTGDIQLLGPRECRFGYRDSVFKHEQGKHWIVSRVCLLLSRNGEPNTRYRDVQQYLAHHNLKNPSLDDMRRVILAIRAQKFPDSSQHGTAGSFFKNPIINRLHYWWLRWRYPSIPAYPMGWWRVKVSAAWILDNVCGLRGYQQGSVGLFEKQPLVVTTRYGATADDVKELADVVQTRVRNATGITLQPEVRFIGFSDTD